MCPLPFDPLATPLCSAGGAYCCNGRAIMRHWEKSWVGWIAQANLSMPIMLLKLMVAVAPMNGSQHNQHTNDHQQIQNGSGVPCPSSGPRFGGQWQQSCWGASWSFFVGALVDYIPFNNWWKPNLWVFGSIDYEMKPWSEPISRSPDTSRFFRHFNRGFSFTTQK